MRLFAVALCLLLGGCQAGYYWHLARGHLALMGERRPVAEVLADGDLAAGEREQLRLAGDILDFAERELALPADGSYRDYVALERDWVVWNLFAAPPFAMEPRRWCYPVAGCAAYRGYFDRQRAERKARALRDQGLEVYGTGAVAYSTLGWFDDPLTTPMLQRNPAGLAELLFHELAHQWLYVADDTRFNESLATAVAAEGTRRWLARRDDDTLWQQWLAQQTAREAVVARVRRTRDTLGALYQSDLPETAMRAAKTAEQQALRDWFERTRTELPELAPWAAFFRGPLNNAQLNTLLDYNDHVPAFNQLLLECGGLWRCFRGRVEALAGLDPEKRQRLLDALHD